MNIDRERSASAVWDAMVAQLRVEYEALSPPAKAFVAAAGDRMAALKLSLHRLTAVERGEEICRSCGGECCRTGKYHVTIPDLLVYLATRDALFTPLFESGRCPFSGTAGCLMPPERRPFNCITFNCDRLEMVAEPDYVHQWRSLERELRDVYADVGSRFGRSFMSGALAQFELGEAAGRPLLGDIHGNRNQ